MKPIASLAELIRQSSEMRDESTRLKERARDTISRSNVVIDQSRELLSSGLVGQTPTSRYGSQQNAMPSSPLTWTEKPKPAIASIGASPEQVVDRDFVDETVMLDGRHFINCSVTNCVLEYYGGPMVLESTQFTDCRFRFGGEAAMTIGMLQCFGLMGMLSPETILPPRVTPNGSSRVN